LESNLFWREAAPPGELSGFVESKTDCLPWAEGEDERDAPCGRKFAFVERKGEERSGTQLV
jgi:hypothetical protein